MSVSPDFDISASPQFKPFSQCALISTLVHPLGFLINVHGLTLAFSFPVVQLPGPEAFQSYLSKNIKNPGNEICK